MLFSTLFPQCAWVVIIHSADSLHKNKKIEEEERKRCVHVVLNVEAIEVAFKWSKSKTGLSLFTF